MNIHLCPKKKDDIDEKQIKIYFRLKSKFFVQYPNQIWLEGLFN